MLGLNQFKLVNRFTYKNKKKTLNSSKWYFAGILVFFIFNFSLSQNSSHGDGLEESIQNLEPQNELSQNSTSKIFISHGATLITSEELKNVEIVEIPKVAKRTSSSIKKSKKNSKKAIPSIKLEEVPVEKPKPTIHFHSKPGSESLLAGSLLKKELIRNINSYYLNEISFAEFLMFSWKQFVEKTYYNPKLNLFLFLDSILARPPPFC